MTITVRLLAPAEWPLYKTMRLKALQSDPGAFGSSYGREAAFTDEEWQQRLKNPSSAIFGVFDGDAAIGITGVHIDPATPATADFFADWLDQNWRGKGLSSRLYEERIAWAKTRPSVRRLLVSYGADNMLAKRIGEKHGFTFLHADEHMRPDGTILPLHYYEMRL